VLENNVINSYIASHVATEITARPSAGTKKDFKPQISQITQIRTTANYDISIIWKLLQGTKGAGAGKDRVHPDSLMRAGQLYNLNRDPYEENDLWDQYPDIVVKLNHIPERITSQPVSN
jgi:hypothetical protein